LYVGRVKKMIMGLLGKDREGLRSLINLIAAFMPAAVFGLLLNKLIKQYLFGPWPVVAAWFIGGVAILVVGRMKMNGRGRRMGGKLLDDMNCRMAVIIGLAQCVAMWPGVSRSLATIVGGLLVGLSLSAAVEFSFLLGVVTLGAATAYDGLKHGKVMLQTFDAMPLAVGLFFAFISAVISIKWMVSYLNRHGLEIFGYYRIALAVVVGALIVAGIL
ncbi:MAG: undecaprenyl-diphosphate phosphatase, partial [Acidobacteriota bacterium]